ncbi:MAG: SusD/RagB family nutrient-binding outer membrane lipoprotein [Prolixibacteraceae bacterium]|nr:SusD/RagB family nutrient-binding outer membrane lipoprotein [Prolixibacteraceae bacterium]
MKTLKYLLIIILSLGAVSCQKDWLDVNQDPNNATTVNPNVLIMYTISGFANNYMDIGPTLMFWSQHWAAGSNGASVFSIPEQFGDMGYTPDNSWATFYLNIKNLKLASGMATEAGNENGAAMCEILMAYHYYAITAIYGDVPFSQAIDPENYPKPEFDNQKDILEGVIEILDSAIARIDESDEAITINEVLFAGDASKWKKFANSLKLRVLNVMASKNPQAYGPQIKSLVENAKLMESEADNCLFPYFDEAGHKNPYYRLIEMYNSGNPAYLYPSTNIVDMLEEDADPRLQVWFQEGQEADPDYFSGVTPGEPGYSDDSDLNANWLTAETDQPFMLFSEVQLLIAEAYASGYMGSVDLAKANEYYRAGIITGMQYHGVLQEDIDNYMGNLVNLTNINQTTAIEAIHKAQYLDLYFLPIDGWVQWRRTGYPDLDLPTGAYLDDFPRRFPMSTDETTSNPNYVAVPQTEKAWLDK